LLDEGGKLRQARDWAKEDTSSMAFENCIVRASRVVRFPNLALGKGLRVCVCGGVSLLSHKLKLKLIFGFKRFA
jgi:hypothetical protein